MPRDSDRTTFDRTTSKQSLVGESILRDVLVNGGTLTSERVAELEVMFESTIRKAAIERKGTENPHSGDLILDVGASLFTELVFAFNILLVGAVDSDDHMSFSFGPSLYVEQNLLEVPNLVENRLRTLTSSGANSTTLARAYIKMIEMALAADFVRKLSE
ncbi:MAG: hypothetical protein ACW975_10185 [Candidatus Thorarchaeota archaeon]|jgi:hypothetical protein